MADAPRGENDIDLESRFGNKIPGAIVSANAPLMDNSPTRAAVLIIPFIVVYDFFVFKNYRDANGTKRPFLPKTMV